MSVSVVCAKIEHVRYAPLRRVAPEGGTRGQDDTTYACRVCHGVYPQTPSACPLCQARYMDTTCGTGDTPLCGTGDTFVRLPRREGWRAAPF